MASNKEKGRQKPEATEGNNGMRGNAFDTLLQEAIQASLSVWPLIGSG